MIVRLAHRRAVSQTGPGSEARTRRVGDRCFLGVSVISIFAEALEPPFRHTILTCCPDFDCISARCCRRRLSCSSDSHHGLHRTTECSSVRLRH
jgi:hypothetical protein